LSFGTENSSSTCFPLLGENGKGKAKRNHKGERKGKKEEQEAKVVA
jgi:hypothetical protein